MSFYLAGEYTTLTETKTQYITGIQTVDNTLLLDQIREASRMIDASAQTEFYPLIQTRNFDLPLYGVDLFPSVPKLQPSDEMKLGGLFGAELRFDRNLLEVVTLTNGDGSSIAAANYWLYPANQYPKRSLKLKPTSGVTWLLDTNGNWEQALTLNGVWGYHEDYNTYAWTDTGNTANTLTTTGTSLAYLGSGTMYAGYLLKIDSEYLYYSAGTASPITVVRGVNGSTATQHTTGAPISYWHVNSTISGIARKASVALYDLRSTRNPLGGTLQIDSISVQTPQDVQKWVEAQIGMNAMSRTVFA